MSVIEARRAETPLAGQSHGDLFAPPLIEVERLADGVMILRSPVPPNAPPRCLSVWLERWASEAPDRIFLAERAGAPGAAAGARSPSERRMRKSAPSPRRSSTAGSRPSGRS